MFDIVSNSLLVIEKNVILDNSAIFSDFMDLFIYFLKIFMYGTVSVYLVIYSLFSVMVYVWLCVGPVGKKNHDNGAARLRQCIFFLKCKRVLLTTNNVFELQNSLIFSSILRTLTSCYGRNFFRIKCISATRIKSAHHI